MSASAKNPAFPLNCASSACNQPLSGPVAFCPYCGASSQVVAAAPAAPAPVVVVSAAPTPMPAAAPAPVIESVHTLAPAGIVSTPVVTPPPVPKWSDWK